MVRGKGSDSLQSQGKKGQDEAWWVRGSVCRVQVAGSEANDVSHPFAIRRLP